MMLHPKNENKQVNIFQQKCFGFCWVSWAPGTKQNKHVLFHWLHFCCFRIVLPGYPSRGAKLKGCQIDCFCFPVPFCFFSVLILWLGFCIMTRINPAYNPRFQVSFHISTPAKCQQYNDITARLQYDICKAQHGTTAQPSRNHRPPAPAYRDTTGTTPSR